MYDWQTDVTVLADEINLNFAKWKMENGYGFPSRKMQERVVPDRTAGATTPLPITAKEPTF